MFLSLVASLGKVCAQVKSSDNSLSDSTLVYVNGEGLTLTLGEKDKFRLNFNGALEPGVQTMHVTSGSETENTNRMSLNLVRLGFYGSGLNNQLGVGILTDFTGTSAFLEGWISFASKNQRMKITFGQRQTNTNNRLALADEKYATILGPSISGKSTDGSIYGGLMQTFVQATREGGIFFESNFNVNEWKFYPSLSITTGDGQNSFDPQPNFGLKYGGRIDVMPMGDFIKNNAFISQDIYHENKPKLAVGFAASYNQKASQQVGSGVGEVTGIYDMNGNAAYADYRKLVADFIFKYQGFAFVGEYIDGSIYGKNLFSDAAAVTKLTVDAASAKYAIGSGINLQSSYVWQKGWAVEVRYANISPEKDIEQSLVQKQDWYTAGFNKYFKKNALKVGINTTFIEQKNGAVYTHTWINNLAVQLLF